MMVMAVSTSLTKRECYIFISGGCNIPNVKCMQNRNKMLVMVE
jgi:hypothetical protein